jgi:hypothetical protein
VIATAGSVVIAKKRHAQCFVLQLLFRVIAMDGNFMIAKKSLNQCVVATILLQNLLLLVQH